MFSLLGRFTYRRRWAVLLVTVLAVPLAGLWGAGVMRRPWLSLTAVTAVLALAALPGVLAFVVAATLVLLGLAFRSAVLPVKAVLAAVLSLAATFGLLTWAIQEGGLAPLLGFDPVGTTDLWLYGIVLVIAFGLTTDYELFIVSRAREEYARTGDTARSVAGALQRTGGVVSGAALLMVVVLATTGIVSDSLVITTLGIGLSVALVLDATLVRALLVPASMRLLGRANWWPAR